MPFDPIEIEMQRLAWEQFYREHPNIDIICFIWLSAMITCCVVLVAIAIAFILGVF
jgi:hypothetical protein